MIDIKQLKEQQREKHPGFNSYLECMTRTLLTGLASFTLGESITFNKFNLNLYVHCDAYVKLFLETTILLIRIIVCRKKICS